MIQRKIIQILLAQILLTLLISMALLLIKGKSSAVSAILGGSVVFLPGLAYALRSAIARGNNPKDWLLAQYAGERAKFFVTMAMFALIFVYDKKLDLIEFFITFLIVQTLYWVALLRT